MVRAEVIVFLPWIGIYDGETSLDHLWACVLILVWKLKDPPNIHDTGSM